MIKRFLHIEEKVIENFVLYNIFKNHQIEIFFYRRKYLKLILCFFIFVSKCKYNNWKLLIEIIIHYFY